MKKLTSAIDAINLTATTIDAEEYAATFQNQVIKPTFINFGFGNNGTGKSSIAKAIRDGVGISWAGGKSSDDYSVIVYDRQFIDDHFANYGYLPGIFTMGSKNIQIQKQIDDNIAQAKKHRDKATAATETKTLRERDRDGLFSSYHELFWQTGASIREDFKKAMTGKIKSKATFAAALLQNTASPTQHDVNVLKELYDIAFGGTPETPDMFNSVDVSEIAPYTEYELLAQPIVGSGDTAFSRFMKALNATDWIKRGLDHYVPNTQGKCPFCQQELPLDFEEQIAACYDEQYQVSITALKMHRKEYEEEMHKIFNILTGNRRKNIYSKFSKERLDLYDSKTKSLENVFKLNLQLLDKKISEPSMSIQLENVDAIFVELNQIIAEYNRQVQASKAILADIGTQKQLCEQKVWELLAFQSQSHIAKYKADDKKLHDEIKALADLIASENKAATALDMESSELNKKIVNIKDAVDGMNSLLHNSGFQGFELRVHEGSGQSAYRVIRPHTGKVAKDLSEGERNFIGFLYFYYLVQGSHSDNEIGRDKIVVIDDPVSSMDATVMHIVGMLTREIIDACLYEKRIKGIKQVFVLTHNVHFHTKVANPLVSRYDIASYFLLKKSNNISNVTHCIKDNPHTVDEKVNYNPVPSEYALLWKEYKTEDKPKALRSLIWQILDYYFIKLSDCNGDELQERVIIKSRDNFTEMQPNGTEDTSKLIMAAKLLAYMGSTIQESDEMFYADHDEDTTAYRKTFEMIFRAMEQNQHYQMMMDEQ